MRFAVRCQWAIAFLASGILNGCGGGGSGSSSGASGNPPPPTVTLQSIVVTPGSLTAGVGGGHQLQASGTYSDGTKKDLTATATWASSSTSVAAVTAAGVITGMSAGSSTISASSGGVSGTDTVTILDNTWAPAASSPVLLSAKTATLLLDGTVLVDGGDPFQIGAAIYDPVADAWSTTTPPATSRYDATATLLKDGRVLVAGGSVLDITAPIGTSRTIILSSAELFDPKTKTWSVAADMPTPREVHAAVLLPSGKVLVVGGDDGHNALPDALLFDPTINTWTPSTTLVTPGSSSTATVLTSGKVLVTTSAGLGSSPGFSEVYDPAAGTWSNGPNMNTVHLNGATATLLNDGRVLLVGGETNPSSGPMATPEVYDPVAGTWTLTTGMTNGRIGHTATLLPSGKVLVAGGLNITFADFATTELFDPATNTWSLGASMSGPRELQGAVLLQSGAVFVTGGAHQGAALQTSELYW